MPTIGLPVGVARPVTRVLSSWALSPTTPSPVGRRRLELAFTRLPVARGFQVEPTTLGGVPCEHLRPRATGARAVLLYLHGGAYVVGSPRTHRSIAAPLAKALNASARVLDYRLAPEHPHPAALDDAVAAYRALVASGVAPDRIVVAGESAGGGLTLALAQALRAAGDPLPAALGLICPWLDLTPDVAGTRAGSPREPVLDVAWLARAAREYVGAADPALPAISPLHGSLDGLAPIVLASAGDDPLLPDAAALEARAAAAGVLFEHHHTPGVWHAFHTFAFAVPQAAAALDRFATALARHLEAPRRALAPVR
jgi:acetyl esterase/lipase